MFTDQLLSWDCELCSSLQVPMQPVVCICMLTQTEPSGFAIHALQVFAKPWTLSLHSNQSCKLRHASAFQIDSLCSQVGKYISKPNMSCDIGFVHAPNYWMECLPTKQRKLTAAPKRVSPPKMPIEAVKEVTDQKVQRQLGSKLMQSTISKSYRVSKN